MAIQVDCPSCARRFQAPDHAAGRTTKCPKCGTPLVVSSRGTQSLESANRPPPPSPIKREEPTSVKAKSLPEPVTVTEGEKLAFAPHKDELPPSLPRISPIVSSAPNIKQLDAPAKIAALIAVVGLILLGVSPLFKWMNFAAGGMIGLKGDGKFVLGVTTAATAIYIFGLCKQQWLTVTTLTVQAWATVAVFWMGAIIWKIGSILDSPNVQGKLFAGLLATQIGPGAGLYVGLICAISVAAALGFIAVRHVGSMIPYCGTQSISLVLGILLALFVGPDGPSSQEVVPQNDSDFSWAFPAASAVAERMGAQAKWKETHNVSDSQWDEMIANYKARKHSESVSQIDWWEEAKTKTPAELNKLYPPLQPHERYRAEWPGRYSQSRELDYGFGDEREKLKIMVMIATEPELPIKELHGHLAFVKGDQIVYETQLAEKPNVSFTDMHFVLLRIPYDDNNPKHRTLRFAKDEELTPVFTVRMVVLADGTEKTFD